MDFLKGIFNGQALTFEQFAEKAAASGVKLANLADGGYVGKEKYAALETRLNAVECRLPAAHRSQSEACRL